MLSKTKCRHTELIMLSSYGVDYVTADYVTAVYKMSSYGVDYVTAVKQNVIRYSIKQNVVIRS